MSYTRITGTTGVKALPNIRGFDSQTGFYITKRYKGTESECGDALETLRANGGVRNAQIEEDAHGYFILSVNYSAESATGGGGVESPASVVTIWSREQVRTEKTLWTSSPWITLSDAIPSIEHRVGLRLAIEDYLSGSTTWTVFSTAVALIGTQSGTGITTDNDTISQLVDHYRKGIEYYNVQGWIFRRVQTGSLQYLVNDDATSLRVWSRNSFASQATMSSRFLTRIPSTGYFLQGGPILTQIDDYKWQCSQDWEYGTEFSTWIYGSAI